MTYLTPESVIRAGREAYQMNVEEPTGQALDEILRQVAIDLDLEGEDYEDLVRHLVTAVLPDPDAYRWATSGGELPGRRRSTVPEGSQGGGWNVSTTSGWSGRTI